MTSFDKNIISALITNLKFVTFNSKNFVKKNFSALRVISINKIKLQIYNLSFLIIIQKKGHFKNCHI